MNLTRNRNQCKKKDGVGGGREKVSLFSFPISSVFDGPGLFAYWQSILYVCLGFGGLFYSAVATRRQPKSLDVWVRSIGEESNGTLKRSVYLQQEKYS